MWLRQPQFPAPLDQSNPLTRGLQFCFDGRSRRDAVSGRLLTPAKPSFSKLGVATEITGSSQIPQLPSTKFESGTGVTFFVLLEHDDFSSWGAMLGRGTQSLATETALFIDGSGFLITVSAGGAQSGPLGAMQSKGVHSYAFVKETGVKGYVDGEYSGTSSPTFSINTDPQTWVVGATSTDYLSECVPGHYLFAAAWNRPLTAQEIAQLHANPWRIYAQGAPDRLLAVPEAYVPVYGTHGQWDETLLIEGWFGEVAGIKGWYAVDFMAPAAPGGTVLKYWNGSAWVAKPLKRWNGSAWVAATLKRRGGSGWV